MRFRLADCQQTFSQIPMFSSVSREEWYMQHGRVDIKVQRIRATWDGRKISRRLLGTGRKLSPAGQLQRDLPRNRNNVALCCNQGGGMKEVSTTRPEESTASVERWRRNRWMEKEKREEPNETREELPSEKKGNINRCGNVKYEDTWVEPKRGH